MNIAFFVNSMATEYPNYTTTVLAFEAMQRGHSICYLTPEDFICRPDDHLAIRTTAPKNRKKFADHASLLEHMQSGDGAARTIAMADIDVLMLRNDPSLELGERPWAEQIGIMFGQLAQTEGVIVLNDPSGLGRAQNKLYFQTYPQQVRARTMICKSQDEIRAFVESEKNKVILKPLQGSGGKNVFIIRSEKDQNLNQIIEAVSEYGYVIAQSYLPKASQGDVRLFVMNGKALQVDGKYAAVRRVPAKGEIRSNIHARGTASKVAITEAELRIVDVVRPKLVQDGMFLVGLDIVGDKILEVNVFSPGALHSCSEIHGVNFAEHVIASIESKLAIKQIYGAAVTNTEIATM
jgi:glutathione synthase